MSATKKKKKTVTAPKKKSAAGKTPDAKLTLRTIAPVLDNPTDIDLRRVVADALLEQNNPWGEFILLQLRIAEKKAKPGDTKLVKTLAKRHIRILCGPIVEAIIQKTAVFEKGFLVECSPERRLVPRPDWEVAARSPYWSTVRTVNVSILTTPQWWVTELMKNPATRNILTFSISGGIIATRDNPSKPWRVKATYSQFFGGYLVAFAKGLRPEDQMALVIDRSVAAKHREALEAALVKGGVRRP